MTLTFRPEINFQTSHHDLKDEDSHKSSKELRSELEAMRKKLADIESLQIKMAEECKLGEERFWSFFQGNDAVKLLVDPSSGEIVDFNHMACAFYGYSPEELRKLNMFDLTPLPEHILRKELHKAGLQWTRTALFLQRLASGALVDVEVSSGPIFIPDRKLILCIINDSTPVQIAIESLKFNLQQSMVPEGKQLIDVNDSGQREYEILLDCTRTQICCFIDQYTYGRANKAYADFFGVEKRRLIKAKITDILQPDQARKIIEENKKVFFEKKQLKTTDWVRNAQEEDRLLSIIKTPVFNFDNKIISVVWTAQDITKIRMNQDAFKGELRTLKSKVMIDELTNIHNRRYLDQELTKEWARAKRNQTSLSLLMLDIDNFKEFNDNYGHVAGDKSLQKVAGILSKTLTRPGDIIARYGGEEFTAILPQTEANGAQTIAEKMRAAVESLQIKHDFSPVGKVLTVSIGSSTMLPLAGVKDLPLEILIKSADRALYEAKQGGKNMVKSKVLKFNGAESTLEQSSLE